MDGILLVNKEKGYTSRDIVNMVGKELHTNKIGHTGTLDPMAEGLLVLCIGKATKLVDVLTMDQKEYIAEVTLGLSSDTLDLEGTILKEEVVHKTKEEIEEVLKTMIGTYEQEVPIYSAIKVKGKKLYEYAREKKEIELPKREVTIHELELLGEVRYEGGKTIFQIRTVVSKGTYIRSLVRDLAKRWNTIGVMSKLTRTKVGNFLLQDSITLEELKQQKYSLLPLEEVLKTYPMVLVDFYLEEKIRHGAILENRYEQLPIVFVNEKKEVLALYQEYEKDSKKIKPWKMF